MDRSIVVSVIDSIKLFDQVVKHFEGSVPGNLFGQAVKLSEGPVPDSRSTFNRDIADQQTRFKVWSGNIGAHHRGASSLDYRLRDSSNIKDQVLNLLKDLTELLQDAYAIVTGKVVPWDQLTDDEDDDDMKPSEESENCGVPATELGQISVDIADVVNCLLRLSAAIRNPAPHDRFIESHSIDTSHFEGFDIQHVSSKFTLLDPVIAERLGRAISRRRQFFRYRQAHRTKLSQGLNHEGVDAETVASSLPEDLKDSFGVVQDFRLTIRDDSSDTGVSQTSYATSVADLDQCRVPPLPEESSMGPFECPFCYTIITATNRTSWKKHIYGDLQPYICLEKDCNTPEKEFSRRHQWMEHVRQNHWKVYACPFACNLTFDSSSECMSHVCQSHDVSGSQRELEAMIQLNERPLDVRNGIPCPICAEAVHSAREYQRHVGRHQEQLALFALSSQEYDNETALSDKSDSDAGSVDVASGEDEQVENDDQPEEQPATLSSIDGTDEVPLPPVRDAITWATGKENEYFIPHDGIDREVITTDITYYLGPEALVRPGNYQNPETGLETQGYYIEAPRKFTQVMIERLQIDSARWDQEKRAILSGKKKKDSPLPQI